jgi:hypothetical protein
MKISSIATFAALAFVLSAGVGSAQGSKDPTGKQDLGVDISGAGTTKADNQKFVEGQTPADQTKIKEACVVFVTEPDQHAPEVIAFCENVKPSS